MAITVNNGGASGRRRFHGMSALSEINVTPFVDVVLVLLIIFMMTAHVMDSGIEVDVPQTKSVKENVKDLPGLQAGQQIIQPLSAPIWENPTTIFLSAAETIAVLHDLLDGKTASQLRVAYPGWQKVAVLRRRDGLA